MKKKLKMMKITICLLFFVLAVCLSAVYAQNTLFDRPANVIDANISCIQAMPVTIPFGIREKFRTEGPGTPATNYCIDGMTSPLVGDLNGDGKPEIIMMGVTEGYTGGAALTPRYILIYNGQTGARMFRYDLGAGAAALTGDVYHRSPSQIAVADLDGDGSGEIVVTTLGDGRVRALKPIFNGATITGMTEMWVGHINGTPINLFCAVF